MRLPNPHFPGFFKVVRTASWRMIYFLPCSHFSIEKFCRLSIAICMEKFSDDLHSLVAPIQRITAKTLHVASTESYPLVRTKQLFFFKETLLCGINYRTNTSSTWSLQVNNFYLSYIYTYSWHGGLSHLIRRMSNK